MGSKLLLADDSITIQKVVGIIFANEDYELTVVDNGDSALVKAKEIVPDVMLVDALMPGLNGYEVCQEVRNDPVLKNMPLLLLTGAFEPFDEDKARQCGADDFISKPFESQHLIDKVKHLLALGKDRAMAAPLAEPEEVFATLAPEPQQPVEPVVPVQIAVEAPVASFAEVKEIPSPVQSDIVEPIAASPDDDLWGIFELEDVETVEPVDFGVTAALPLATVEEIEVEESFTFVEDEEEEVLELGSAVEAETFSAKWEPVEEQTFSFQEEAFVGEEEPVREFEFSDYAPTEAVAVETFVEESSTPSFSGWTETAAPEELKMPDISPEPEIERQFAPEEEYIPTEAAMAGTSVAVPSAAICLSEEQIAAAVAKVSREIIEKIVWEVVPDLAEMLIKEEIRKLREGQ